MTDSGPAHLFNKFSPVTLFRIYYYITPVFFILDSVWGKIFRVAGLDDPLHRSYYYLFCLLCGLICYFNHKFSYLVTLLESSINMLILLLGVMVPVYSLGNLDEQNISNAIFTGQRFANFLLAGSWILYSFYAVTSGNRNQSGS